MQFRGHQSDVRIMLQAFLGPVGSTEECDKDDVSLVHSMLLQHMDSCDDSCSGVCSHTHTHIIQSLSI